MKNILSALPSALVIAACLIVPSSAPGQVLSKSLQSVVDADTVRNVWVFFKDRPGDATGRVSERASLRRRAAGFNDSGKDRPVHRGYINDVVRLGGALRHTFDWENAASFSVHASRLAEIASLPFVNRVVPVAVYVRKNAGDAGASRLGRSARTSAFGLPGYGWHMDMLNIPLAHEYLAEKGVGAPGSGVLMAFFDSGFRLDHAAFSRLRDSAQVSAAYDFVDGDASVFDPDSVVADPLHAYHQNDEHGTNVLGLVAGHHPGHYFGAAWGASFALARTENDAVETRVEEDSWAAAVLWAEAMGVNIISSSLGYRDGFDDPSEDYIYGDMNGATTIVSMAAAGAVARGVIVVNSMGNDGNHATGTISAPADVSGVVAVGSVDIIRGLSSFSSTGPTFDGRIKPDVVAPGSGVPLASPYLDGLNQYRNGNGTSFSAPLVSGLLAMILQANPGISAEEARERLYRSCVFAPQQTFRDNRYGHGIPNAMHAIMAENEIFVKITDNAGAPLAGAQVRLGANTYDVGESGNLLITAPPSDAPAELKIFFRNDEVGSVIVNALPFSDVINTNASREGGLRVQPGVVSGNSVVRGRFQLSGLDVSVPVTATVFALNGRKVWQQPLRVRPDGTAEFVWDRRGAGDRRSVPPGVYFIAVKHGYNMIGERVLITR